MVGVVGFDFVFGSGCGCCIKGCGGVVDYCVIDYFCGDGLKFDKNV